MNLSWIKASYWQSIDKRKLSKQKQLLVSKILKMWGSTNITFLIIYSSSFRSVSTFCERDGQEADILYNIVRWILSIISFYILKFLGKISIDWPLCRKDWKDWIDLFHNIPLPHLYVNLWILFWQLGPILGWMNWMQ